MHETQNKMYYLQNMCILADNETTGSLSVEAAPLNFWEMNQT